MSAPLSQPLPATPPSRPFTPPPTPPPTPNPSPPISPPRDDGLIKAPTTIPLSPSPTPGPPGPPPRTHHKTTASSKTAPTPTSSRTTPSAPSTTRISSITTINNGFEDISLADSVPTSINNPTSSGRGNSGTTTPPPSREPSPTPDVFTPQYLPSERFAGIQSPRAPSAPCMSLILPLDISSSDGFSVDIPVLQREPHEQNKRMEASRKDADAVRANVLDMLEWKEWGRAM